MTPLLSDFVTQHLPLIEEHLSQALPSPVSGGERLIDAMRYSLLNGGKRIRPLLVLAAAKACGIDVLGSKVYSAGVAVEYIHAYSLIHDDLPAMDDDDLRRGQPTCHIAFDEATAILAGDALQCAAFEVLSESVDTLALVAPLAKAAGARGMVVGQAIDLAAVDQALDLQQLSHMHKHKTGALIEVSVQMGAIVSGANRVQLKALQRYAAAIGLAFQIQDDILDVTADTHTLGKQQGADAANNKPTYVSLLGLDEAKRKAQHLLSEAKTALAPLPNGEVLAAIADYIVERGN
ncbi:farnesyl diphosphate synthase [Marinagarivorans algicola]|uniref:farnesyl diphosphate synthase n=1 Tax=Marinagarivorans algicola TaxID=1513270 RepID=UPI0006B637C0